MFSSLSSGVTKGMKSLGLSSDSVRVCSLLLACSECVCHDAHWCLQTRAMEREEKAASMSKEDAACYLEWGLTIAEEDELIEQLKEEVELEAELNEMWDKETLRRFLRARKHDILKAKTMILKTIEWRRENNVDTILDDFEFGEKEQFHKHYPEGFFCTDRQGRPVYVQKPGDINCSELWKFTTLERSIKYHITQQERYVRTIAPSAALRCGRGAFQSTVLIDMDGVGVATLTGEVRTIMGKVMSIDQDHYPELMHKALIINAPTSFRIIWSLVKHLLDARTQEKIEVLPTDYKPVLLEHIAPENLMECYGGTNTSRLIDCPGLWNNEDIKAELAEKVKAHRETIDRFFSAHE